MKYPYINYIKALLLKGHRPSVINERLRAFRLVPPDESEIEEIRDKLFSGFTAKQLKYIEIGPSYDFKKFLKLAEEPLSKLHFEEILSVLSGNRNTAWEEALFIMTDPDIRIIVMCMSVQNKNPDEIGQAITNKTRIQVSEEGILYFYKYFWNITEMSKLELYHFLATGLTMKHRNLVMDAFHHNDSEVQWRISGKSVITLEEVLTTVMNEAFIKFKASADSDDVDNVARVQQWANLAIKAAEKLSDVARNDAPNMVASLELQLKKLTQDDIKTMGDEPKDTFEIV